MMRSGRGIFRSIFFGILFSGIFFYSGYSFAADKGTDGGVNVLFMAPGYNTEWEGTKDRDSIQHQFKYIFFPPTLDEIVKTVQKLGRKVKIKKLVFLGHGDPGGNVIDLGDGVGFGDAALDGIANNLRTAGDSSVLDAFADNAEIIYLNCMAGLQPKLLKSTAELFLAFSGGTVFGSDQLVRSDLSTGNTILTMLSNYLPYIAESVNFTSPSRADYRTFRNCTLAPFPYRDFKAQQQVVIKGPDSANVNEKAVLEAMISDQKSIPAEVRPFLKFGWQYSNKEKKKTGKQEKLRVRRKFDLKTIDMDTSAPTTWSVDAELFLDNGLGSRKLGKARHILFVEKKEDIAIDLSSKDFVRGQTLTARAYVRDGETPKDGMWAWKSEGGVQIKKKTDDAVHFKAAGEGLLSAQLYSLGLFGKKKVLGEASIPIKPKPSPAADSPTIDNPLDKPKVKPTESTVDETQGKNGGPVTVADKKPAAFSGKEKPEGSTGSPAPKGVISPPSVSPTVPPPSTTKPLAAKEMKANLMDCLCEATESGYKYTPDECAKAWPGSGGVCSYSGPLGGFFCRPMKPKTAEGAAGCYEGAYGKKAGSAELSQIEKDIRDANKKNKKPLKVTLTPDAKPIKAQYGTTISLTANVEGGTPGYTYSWSGNGEGKDNTFTFINTRKPGSSSISVTVNDSDGSTATAGTTVVVEAITVRVEKTSPPTDTVTVGGKAQFKATVMSGTGQASGNFNFQWQPHPEIEFNPFEKSATTTATFRKPGTHNIYVHALVKDGAKYTTLGESNQVTITAVNPSWKMEFNPQEPLTGQEVRAKISPDAGADGSQPDMKEMNFRWQLPANAKQKGTSQDDREITFYLTDDKPANISCLASTKYDNTNLGGAGKTIKAKSYNLTINGPRPRQEFQVWKCETQLGGAPSCGMKKVENQYAVDQEILFSSKIEPAPEKPVSYNWTASPEGCTFNSNGGSATSITCRSTGGYALKVTAKTDGMEIGSATADVSVTISQDDIARSNKAKEAYEKLQKAKELVKQDKLDEGIQMAGEALSLDSKNTEAKNLQAQWQNERQQAQRQLAQMRKALLGGNLQQAGTALAAARKVHPQYAPVVAAAAEYEKIQTGTVPAGELVNLALHKPVTQSSTYGNNSATYGPQIGVDGNTNESSAAGFFHTNLEKTPWWQVDLQNVYALREIRLYNRTQMLSERARALQVQLSTDGTGWETIYRHDGSIWTRLNVGAGGKAARFVRVQLNEKNYLHLDEVEVYGVNGATNDRDLSPQEAKPDSLDPNLKMPGTQAAKIASASVVSGQWLKVETTPGLYSLTLSGNTLVVAKQGNSPGGLQNAGMNMDLSGNPVTGDFEVQVGFRNARIDGGLNQVQLHATFADSFFLVVRDQFGSGSHIWTPGIQGDAPCGNSGTLRIERRGEKVTGYCDDRAIWSDTRKSPLQSLSFILQNNGTNDPISVTFHDWRFAAAKAKTKSADSIGSEDRGVHIGPMEMDTDRAGADIRGFDLPTANPAACRAECARTQECTAWTYVKPNTIRGPRPRCFLKHSSPGKSPNTSCISGIIERDPQREK